MRPCLLSLLCVFILSFVGDAQAANPQIVEVTSPKGIKAWLVEDHKLPLVSVHFAFRGGVEQDPSDKQGLAMLASSLLTQGAGPYDDRAFQERLAANAISLGVSAARDQIDGQMKTLTRTREEAFRLLALALTKPRFDAEAFDRLRDAQLTAIKFQLSSPDWQGRYALYQHIFGDHPYGYRSMGSAAAVARLTREDAAQFVRDHLAKDNLMVAVVGDIDRETLAQKLDQVFGALPERAVLKPLADVVWPSASQKILVERQGKQTNILLARPMLRRDDPDWYAAQIANYILGGGGFISRLMKAVRTQEGLTYGVGTALSSMDHAAMLVASLSADNDKAAAALDLLSKVWQSFYEGGATQEEIDAAKAYLIGAMPISLTSTDAIGETLLTMQTEKLGIDYLDRRAELLQAVEKKDVDRVVKRWFDPGLTSGAFVGMPTNLAVDKKVDAMTE